MSTEIVSSRRGAGKKRSRCGNNIRDHEVIVETGLKSHVYGGVDDEDSAEESRTNINYGPISVKMKKSLNNDVIEKRKFRRTIQEINKNMTESNKIHQLGGMMDRRLGLLSVMQKGSAEYRKLLSIVMRDDTMTIGEGAYMSGVTTENYKGRQFGEGDDVLD